MGVRLPPPLWSQGPRTKTVDSLQPALAGHASPPPQAHHLSAIERATASRAASRQGQDASTGDPTPPPATAFLPPKAASVQPDYERGTFAGAGIIFPT